MYTRIKNDEFEKHSDWSCDRVWNFRSFSGRTRDGKYNLSKWGIQSTGDSSFHEESTPGKMVMAPVDVDP